MTRTRWKFDIDRACIRDEKELANRAEASAPRPGISGTTSTGSSQRRLAQGKATPAGSTRPSMTPRVPCEMKTALH
jgi:hypothetical protein